MQKGHENFFTVSSFFLFWEKIYRYFVDLKTYFKGRFPVIAEITRMLAANNRRQLFFVFTTTASTRYLVENFPWPGGGGVAPMVWAIRNLPLLRGGFIIGTEIFGLKFLKWLRFLGWVFIARILGVELLWNHLFVTSFNSSLSDLRFQCICSFTSQDALCQNTEMYFFRCPGMFGSDTEMFFLIR